ncbi:hypothetical protein ACOQFL_16885 [Actinopolyspora sp. H202]|uniref:hypothetical protein n=1 Tax=Actinopolyspora sp. H202 TaxID=1500456 RepID=UPI003EE5EE75
MTHSAQESSNTEQNERDPPADAWKAHISPTPDDLRLPSGSATVDSAVFRRAIVETLLVRPTHGRPPPTRLPC